MRVRFQRGSSNVSRGGAVKRCFMYIGQVLWLFNLILQLEPAKSSSYVVSRGRRFSRYRCRTTNLTRKVVFTSDLKIRKDRNLFKIEVTTLLCRLCKPLLSRITLFNYEGRLVYLLRSPVPAERHSLNFHICNLKSASAPT
jgi:hypothetical protein